MVPALIYVRVKACGGSASESHGGSRQKQCVGHRGAKSARGPSDYNSDSGQVAHLASLQYRTDLYVGFICRAANCNPDSIGVTPLNDERRITLRRFI